MKQISVPLTKGELPAYPSKTSPRELELSVISTLEQSLSASGGISELILQPSPENNEILLGVRNFILSEISPDLAMTDPSLYRKLCRLKMEMTLRGWHHYFRS